MFRSVRASRLTFARFARQQSVIQTRTFLAPTAALRADLVQDLYLRELKNYKPPAVKAGDAEAHVQKFSPPKLPPSPEESDIAKDLKAYEKQQVEVEGQPTAGEDVPEENWFEDEDDMDDEGEAHSSH